MAAALVASEAWRSGRRTLASCLVLSIVAGEGFGLIMGAERLLFAREERQRAASEVNTARWIATVRVELASSMLAITEAALLKEMGRGGCKSACQALQAEAEQARQRLEAANRALQSAPAEKNTALLATTLGLPPALLEIVPALLFSAALNGLAFTLLAFGAHVPNQERRGGAGRAGYASATSARPGGTGALLCRCLPQAARSRSELHRGSQ